MKKTAIIIVISLLLLMCFSAYAQDAENSTAALPQVIAAIPDPSEVLGSLGSLYQADFVYLGNIYDAYLFPLPQQIPPFVETYGREASAAGYEAVADVVEGYEALRIYDFADESKSALLFYNYQGYMLLMVPKDMQFTLHEEITEPLSPERMVELGNQAISAGDYQTALRYLIKAAGNLIQSSEQTLLIQPPTQQPAATATPTPFPMITNQPSLGQLYTVQDGDSCWSIAAANGLDIQYFMEANGFTECNIIIGDEVIIPNPEMPTATPIPLPGAQQTYVVESGDSCWSIAVDKYGVNFELFMAVNGFSECDIHVGDEVIIPGDDDMMPTSTPIPLDQYTTGQQIQYTVEMNDSYNDIAAKFNTTLVSIQQLNNVNVYSGFPQYGQVLTIAVNLITPTPSPVPTATPEVGTLQP